MTLFEIIRHILWAVLGISIFSIFQNALIYTQTTKNRSLPYFILLTIFAVNYQICSLQLYQIAPLSEAALPQLLANTAFGFVIIGTYWFISRFSRKKSLLTDLTISFLLALFSLLIILFPDRALQLDTPMCRTLFANSAITINYHEFQPSTLLWGLYLTGFIAIGLCGTRLYHFVKERMQSYERGPMVCYALFLVTLINDLLVRAGLLNSIYLLDVSFMLMISGMAMLIASRFIYNQQRVEDLNATLDHKVHMRTLELLEEQKKTRAVSNERRQLIHILCHDLVNPLNGVAHLIQHCRDNGEISEDDLHMIDEAVNNCTNIVSVVRTVMAVDSGKMTLALEPIQLLDAVEEACRVTNHLIVGKNIDLQLAIDPELCVLAERTSLINSIINNLLTNAIKFSEPSSPIRISTEVRNDGQACLTIRDYGIGMPTTLLMDLFEVGTVTTRQGTSGEKGTGFGMPLVKKLLDSYGAKINIWSREPNDSPENHGTEITLIFKKPF